VFDKNLARWAKANLGFAIGILAVGSFSSLALLSHHRSNTQVDWVHHTHEVLFDISNVRRLIDELQSSERGYVIARTDRFLDGFKEARPQLEPALEELKNLVGDNPAQVGHFLEIESLARKSVQDMERLLALTEQGRAEEAISQITAGVVKVKVDRIRDVLSEMEKVERNLLNQRLSEMRRASKVTRFLLAAGGVITILSLLLAAFALNRRLRAQLQAERELNQFFANSIDIFCITDPQGRFLRYNNVMTKALGYGPTELLGGQTIMDFVHPDDEQLTNDARRLRQEGKLMNGFEHRVRRKDGSYTTRRRA
jgi:PAS domain S-box-containing protein